MSSWIIPAFVAGAIYLIATNLKIIPDREVWVTERFGTRRFLKKGIRFMLPFDLEQVVCKIPTQPQLVEMRGERFNIPDGTCNLTASLEYKVRYFETAYERIVTNKSQKNLNINSHIQPLFVTATRDLVKRLPIEALCEEEEDNFLAQKLREKMEYELLKRGIVLVDDEAVKIQSVELDAEAEQARRLRYKAMKETAAKKIYSQGQVEAIKTLMQEMNVTKEVAMNYYQQLEALATVGNLNNVGVSDFLGSQLL
jgi:regulator of protease activity HflC (stomatin/prohibitin superfamily)